MKHRTEILILGGGVIGCAIAFELARKGRKVAVLERNSPGCESSNAAAGILGPQIEASGPGPLLELKLAGKALFAETADLLHRETGIDVEYRPIGVLHLILSESEESTARERLGWQQRLGLQVSFLSAQEVLAVEPCTTPNVRGALHYPDDHQINNANLVKALYQDARMHGAKFSLGNPATAILREGSQVRGASSPCEEWEADAVVICAGSWSAQLSRLCGFPIPLTPARGQMLLTSSTVTPLRKVVAHGSCYLVPRVNGEILVGSNVEFVGYDKRVTASGVHDILTRAFAAVPTLAQESLLATWAGLRPHCQDGLPILGAIPGTRGAFLATGHFRNGILLSLITGRVMAQLILGENPTFPLKPFRPDRFVDPSSQIPGEKPDL